MPFRLLSFWPDTGSVATWKGWSPFNRPKEPKVVPEEPLESLECHAMRCQAGTH